MGAQPRVPAQRTPKHDTLPSPDQRLQEALTAMEDYRLWRRDFMLPRMEGRAPTSTAK